MIDLYLLEELVAFQKYGTLAQTADHLAVTQPTVTRGMQKLEAELGVQLFDRQPNKISLTPTGEFAAKTAQTLLTENKAFASKIKQFNLSQTQITIAANAPGPLLILKKIKNSAIKTNPQLIAGNYQQLLLNEQYTCLFINQPLNNDKIASIYLGSENLEVHLNEFTELASRQQVSFSDLKNLTFLVVYDVGVWRQVIQDNIPGAKFLYQTDRGNFEEIRHNSIFPYFTTNLSAVYPIWQQRLNDNDRQAVPIKDPAARQQFYACFLKRNQKRLSPLIEQMQDQWAKADE
ncbi:MAG: LysR family transcriptional regulator [Lactobacillus sp.]|jgi:DNA-binding transcriptional LysR family regulator|nr:LysR family transcriptional regulator [Lactobacillus sp.]